MQRAFAQSRAVQGLDEPDEPIVRDLEHRQGATQIDPADLRSGEATTITNEAKHISFAGAWRERFEMKKSHAGIATRSERDGSIISPAALGRLQTSRDCP